MDNIKEILELSKIVEKNIKHIEDLEKRLSKSEKDIEIIINDMNL